MILGSTRRGEAALAAIDVENALHVGLDLGARIDRARLELHLGLQRVGVDLAVALEGDLIDDGVLDDVTTTALPSRLMCTSAKRPVANSACSDCIDLAGVVGVADGELEVGANRFGLDAPIAFDADVADDALRRSGAW